MYCINTSNNDNLSQIKVYNSEENYNESNYIKNSFNNFSSNNISNVKNINLYNNNNNVNTDNLKNTKDFDINNSTVNNNNNITFRLDSFAKETNKLVLKNNYTILNSYNEFRSYIDYYTLHIENFIVCYNLQTLLSFYEINSNSFEENINILINNQSYLGTYLFNPVKFDLDLYYGSWDVNNNKQGYGHYILKDKIYFVGEFNKNIPIKGIFINKHDNIYIGEFKNELATNTGLLIKLKSNFANKSIFNSISSVDKICNSDNSNNKQEFAKSFNNFINKIKINYNKNNDTLNNYLELINDIEFVYYGEFKNGMQDGKGICLYCNSCLYEGYFTKGLKNGYGTIINDINGFIISGYFSLDKLDESKEISLCCQINENTKYEYKGLLNNYCFDNSVNKSVNSIVNYYDYLNKENEIRYNGSYKNNKKHGKGDIILYNKFYKYIQGNGTWYNDCINGSFEIIILENKIKFDTYWRLGKMVKYKRVL